MSHGKEQSRVPEKDLNKAQESKLPDAAFKTLVMKRKLSQLRRRLDELSEHFNQEIKT